MSQSLVDYIVLNASPAEHAVDHSQHKQKLISDLRSIAARTKGLVFRCNYYTIQQFNNKFY